MIWKFYSISKDDNSMTVCNYCKKDKPKSGKDPRKFNTSNLKYHLITEHSDENKNFNN